MWGGDSGSLTSGSIVCYSDRSSIFILARHINQWVSSVFIAHELQFAAVVIVHSCAPREQAFRILAHRRHVQG